MYTLEVAVEGITPVLLASQGARDEGPQKGSSELWIEPYQDEGGVFYPAWNWIKAGSFGAMMGNLKLSGTKIGGLKLFEGYIKPAEINVYFDRKEDDGYITTFLRKPDGKQAILHRKHLKNPWHATFRLLVMDDRITPEWVRTAYEHGGVVGGIGPHRKLYGKFKVISCQKVE